MARQLQSARLFQPQRSSDAVVAVAVDRLPRERLRIRAVRFHGARVADGYDGAPQGFPPFAGDAPIAGFGLAERLAGVTALGADFAENVWDVGELASYVAPEIEGSSLEALAGVLGVDALPDEPAEQVRLVYAALLARARALAPAALHRLTTLLTQAQSPLAELVGQLSEASGGQGGSVLGVDTRELQERLQRPRSIGEPLGKPGIDPDEVEGVLSPGGQFARRFPGFEPRPEQVAMARAVAQALSTPESDAPQQLLIEGGTGIGKSVGYLVPAILFALRNNARVVVSTNTINLQEQLIHKDIPDVLAALQDVQGLDLSRFRYTQFKGRANYLCLRRWSSLMAAPSLSADEARMLARSLVWIDRTQTGDRSELSLRGREPAAFERISASGFAACPGAREGACFYRHAKDEASAAHLVIVNHALLLSDLKVEGALLPEYDYLIIDEAHNLEAQATQQFGFRLTQGTVDDLIDQGAGALQGVSAALRVGALDAGRKETTIRLAEAALTALPAVRDAWRDMMAGLVGFAKQHRRSDEEDDLRILASMRSQPEWSEIEIAWDNFERQLKGVADRVEAFARDLDSLDADGVPGLEERRGELTQWLVDQAEAREQVAGFVSRPDQTMVYWFGGQGGGASLNGAPLEVASRLEPLFSGRQATILTSATMTVRGDFALLRGRLGLESPAELALDSPFDYEKAALLCIPVGLPQPQAADFDTHAASALHDLALKAGGYTMALFTSHAALRSAATALRRRLGPHGIQVLAQGIDGTPQQLIVQFRQQPRAVLLGTASFWEGVDIGNAALKVLALARLPFAVPSDPVFEARSELYENPFMEYALPLAVLRFRQGFGRLIRGKTDRGACVVLDPRITQKQYGRWFLASLPSMRRLDAPLDAVASGVDEWLSAGAR